MGFLDAIKRWRLAQQGLSSGKKRRIHSENPVIQALEDSLWVKLALYATFTVSCGVMTLKASQGTAFADAPIKGALYGFIIAVTAVLMFQVSLQTSCRRNSRVVLVLGGLLAHLALLRVVMSLASAGHIPEMYRFFFVPFALAPMLHGVLLGRAVGSFSAVFVTLIGCLFAPQGQALPYMILSLVAGVTSVLLAHQVRRRLQLLQTGIYVGAVTLLLGLLLGSLDVASCFGPGAIDHLQVLGTGSAAAFGTAVFTALLVSGLLPIFEGAFLLTTDISWLELSDLNHKLLRQMQLEAPGTFHHSLVVAALSEAAAEKIGANAPMCRVCSYFHDVGKLKKPGYFIENQHEGAENPHETLTPTMSTLIILAHVKDGVDLAVKHKLNPRIIDVIQEHHGDSIVAYFYHKAREQKKLELEKVDRRLENPEDLPSIDEKNFRYPGPRPSSRECGIIALADSIESASRTLRKPTPARIRALVDDLVHQKIQDGQLDDCPLTLREIAIVKDSFATTLRSMLHTRIDYPKDDDRPSATLRRAAPDRTSSRGGRVIPRP
ncbi:MAG: HDIG domain-containing protein [Verrucomicrobiaceae bacterium]|nr:MAG: HDIG domain-containing protein [Verrucomicrobiaceae bacterium]